MIMMSTHALGLRGREGIKKRTIYIEFHKRKKGKRKRVYTRSGGCGIPSHIVRVQIILMSVKKLSRRRSKLKVS